MAPLPRRIRTVLLVAALGLGAAASGVRVASAQVSPGPLAEAHKELDSTLKCFACHGKRGEKAMRERCLECHKEIALLVGLGRGLHGQKGTEKCAACHPDHAGREFQMVAWPEGGPEKFDHQRAGWGLTGKHAALKCAQCHKPELQTSESIRLSTRKDRSASWLGLETTCGACHRKDDVHRGALGQDCARCHSDTAWKQAVRFDHAKTSYPLTGRHAQVPCDKCHLAPWLRIEKDPAGKPIPIYKPVPHQKCGDCHQDPHQGKLGAECSRCHVTEAWKAVDPKAFNHDRTRYPLRGRHAALKCGQCHDNAAAWGKKPPFATCGGCHADTRTRHPDPHAGTATLAGKPADCASCHDVGGWKPSTFTLAQHAAAKYPLAGAHRKVACDACHFKPAQEQARAALGSAGVLMRPSFSRCRDCHGEDHGAQLAKRADKGACEACHTVDAWKPSTFTAGDHARLRLPLEGRHAKAACAACHGPDRRGLAALPGPEALGRARVAIHVKEIACVDCHADPHEGRFEPGGERARKNGCLACHGLDAFRPSKVDVAAHRAYGYALEGAHGAVPCDECHKDVRTPPQTSSLLLARAKTPPILFKTKSDRCEDCHANPHGAQFATRRDKGDCRACHSELAFRPASRFDHNRDAAFRLDGGHVGVPCAKCHPSRTDASGKPVIVYRPVPTDCRSCHAKGVPQAPAPPRASQGRVG